MSEKTVFISYRRDSIGKWFARSLKQELHHSGYDAFLDVDSLESGPWKDQIQMQVAKRAHFLLLLTPGALDRCADPDDWVRKEFEAAKGSERNIVPILEESVDTKAASASCPESMKNVFDLQKHKITNAKFNDDIKELVSRYIPPHKAPTTTPELMPTTSVISTPLVKDSVTHSVMPPRALILEDQSIIYEPLEQRLKQIGFSVIVVETGAEARRELDRDENFELVILDLQLDEHFSGHQIIAYCESKPLPKTCAKVVFTGHPSEKDRIDQTKWELIEKNETDKLLKLATRVRARYGERMQASQQK